MFKKLCKKIHTFIKNKNKTCLKKNNFYDVIHFYKK